MGLVNDVLGYVWPSREKPQAFIDNAKEVRMRGGRYGELFTLGVNPTKQLLCDEGSYYAISNPTPGTAIARAANAAGNTSFSDTVALFVVKNNAPNGSSVRTHLDRLKLILTPGTAPTATVSMHFAVKIDNINRAPSAGARVAAGSPPLNTNMDALNPQAPNTLIWEYSAADLTVPASSQNARVAARASIQTGLGIIGDEYVVQFGGVDDHGARSPLAVVRATDVAKMTTNANPVALGPQQYAVIHMWWLTAATTAQTFEYELSVVER